MHWSEFKEGCTTHEDCREMNGVETQWCTQTTWDATSDRKSYGSANACYTTAENSCPQDEATPSTSILNTNYANSGEFSYFIQSWCRGARATDKSTEESTEESTDDGASYLVASVATIGFAVASLF